MKRTAGLKRGTKPLARRTPLTSGAWHRDASELWAAIEAMCPETGKGIADRLKYDEERAAAEWARKYGSIERVLFVKHGGPCSTPRCGGRPCDNSHYGTEGMGRKAHHTRILRQCRKCHDRVGDIGWPAFLDENPGLDPERECEVLDIHWQEHGADWVAWYYGDDAVPSHPHDREPDEDRLLELRFGGEF